MSGGWPESHSIGGETSPGTCASSCASAIGPADEEYVEVLAADTDNQTFTAIFAKGLRGVATFTVVAPGQSH